jgi:hypothetical protein
VPVAIPTQATPTSFQLNPYLPNQTFILVVRESWAFRPTVPCRPNTSAMRTTMHTNHSEAAPQSAKHPLAYSPTSVFPSLIPRWDFPLTRDPRRQTRLLPLGIQPLQGRRITR